MGAMALPRAPGEGQGAPPNLARVIIGGNIGAGKTSVITALSRARTAAHGDGQKPKAPPLQGHGQGHGGLVPDGPGAGDPSDIFGATSAIAGAEKACYIYTREPTDDWKPYLESMYNATGDDPVDKSAKLCIFQMAVYMHFAREIERVNRIAWEVHRRTNGATAVVHVLERSMFDAECVFVPALIGTGELIALHRGMMDFWRSLTFAAPDTYCGGVPPERCMYVLLDVKPEICLDRIKERARGAEVGVTLEYITALHDRHHTTLQNALESALIKVHLVDAGRGPADVMHAIASLRFEKPEAEPSP